MELVQVSRPQPGVCQLTLSRPDALNAMTAPLVAEFHRQLEAIERDPQCRVLVLTGAGRAFCAGLDLRGYGDGELVAARGKVRIAATSAVFAVSFIRAGYSACDLGTSWLLPRIVGTGRAHELMPTGRRISAEEALRIGLVTELVASGDLMPNALAKAAEIMLNPPLSVELTKQGMWTALETPSFSASVEFENRQQVLTAMTDDQAEAAAAFLGKRAPAYRYR